MFHHLLGPPQASSRTSPIHAACSRSARCLGYLGLVGALGLVGCGQPPAGLAPEPPAESAVSVPAAGTAAPVALDSIEAILQESWIAYRQRFIQDDGRVIDWESRSRTVSEAQAYAMLRAVMADDPDTFALVLEWAENNLQRQTSPGDADGRDNLWVWKWGQLADGSWGPIDSNFASDADIDAVTALIWAARRWQRPDYLELAQAKLVDIWDQSTLALPALEPGTTRRYLLPGPLEAFQPRSGAIYLNPSYFAPYAFRLFAQVDPERDWLSLVESSYQILEQTGQVSPRGLPGDWVIFDLSSQTLEAVDPDDRLKSTYSFDAYRVWWRISLDAAWFGEERADEFLRANLGYLESLWQQEQFIPAALDPSGAAEVDYESTAHYAMLYPAFRRTNPAVAAEMLRQKLLAAYEEGIWDNKNAYYVQNLAWLGLFPPDDVSPELLQKDEDL